MIGASDIDILLESQTTVDMSAVQAPMGTLYPDIVALRHIFGYSDYSLRTTFALDNTKIGPRIEGSLLADVLVVSVDIDTGSFESYRVLSDEKQYSIGISVLDTRTIQGSITDSVHDRLVVWAYDSILSVHNRAGKVCRPGTWPIPLW